MSDYAAFMRQETSSWASAYLQFETGRSREGYRAYAFVEDDDDKSFYQVALSAYDHICYLGCGGKTGVFSVFKKLKDSGAETGHLFLVDRDTESEPMEHASEILRTSSYSWESHVCEPDFVGWLLQRKFDPNLTAQERALIENSWRRSVEAFKQVLSKHTALCQTALVLDESLGMRDVTFWRDAVWVDNELRPGPSSLDWHPGKMALAIEKGAPEVEINSREAHFAGRDVLSVSRGKALFSMLRVFYERTQASLERTMLGQWNSARAWIEAMPWTHPRLQYVRDYAQGRIGAP